MHADCVCNARSLDLADSVLVSAALASTQVLCEECRDREHICVVDLVFVASVCKKNTN